MPRRADMAVSTRADARAAGARFFFTGRACSNGHVAPRYVSTGGCKQCGLEAARRLQGHGARPSAAEYLKRVAGIVEAKGGRLVSDRYVSAKARLLVDCGAGHPPFSTDADHLRQGTWCPRCRHNQSSTRQRAEKSWTADQLRAFVRRRWAGDCLAEGAATAKQKVLWRCHVVDHPTFTAAVSNVVNSGSWCPACWNQRQKPPKPPMELARFEKVVQELGGMVVSGRGAWQGGRTRVSVRCADGHEWEVTATSVVHQRSWCPTCNALQNIGEGIARAIFEETFGLPFPSIRPDWLRGQRGRPMELDGYCEALALAFEYQGPHHSTDPHVASRDRMKRQLCEERGITLVEVQATKQPRPPENVLPLVADGLRAAGRLEAPRLPPLAELPVPSQLLEGRRLAAGRGGALLSTSYDGGELEWKCSAQDHPPWRAELWRIRKGHWCRLCSRSAPLDLERFRAWGTRVGLELLDKHYTGSRSQYRWRCIPAGHEDVRSRSNIEQSVRRGLPACKTCAGTAKRTADRAMAARGHASIE